jgi:parallel beta-helix repeat protein
MRGVRVSHDGRGILEDNDITVNAGPGVIIAFGGNPTLRSNRVNHNLHEAIRIQFGGRGVLEDNNLTANERGAWNISEDSRAHVTRKRNKRW